MNKISSTQDVNVQHYFLKALTLLGKTKVQFAQLLNSPHFANAKVYNDIEKEPSEHALSCLSVYSEYLTINCFFENNSAPCQHITVFPSYGFEYGLLVDYSNKYYTPALLPRNFFQGSWIAPLQHMYVTAEYDNKSEYHIILFISCTSYDIDKFVPAILISELPVSNC